MDLDQLKQILDLVREHDLSEFEIEHDGLRLKVRKDPSGGFTMPPAGAAAGTAAGAPAAGAAGGAAAPASGGVPAEVDDTEIELAVVKSPIVGTFYR